jgi:hypothetical protein
MTQEIKPTYATFEQAESYCDLKLLQLLYDKGLRFKLETEGHRVINNLAEQRFNEGDVSYCNNYITYSVVIEWLRVNHGIWVEIKPECYGDHWYANLNICSREAWDNLYKRNEVLSAFREFNNEHPTPQEAYSAAFDYILNNLI